VRLGQVLAIMVVTAAGADTQSAASEWFPAHPGDRWIYEFTTRDDNGRGRAHLDVHSWKTEETTSGTWDIPEGLLVARQVRVIEGAPRAGWRVDPNPAYLVRGDCLYAGFGVGWDPETHRLTEEFRKELLAGQIAPDFCFPLSPRKQWGALDSRPDSKVKGAKGDTFHITNISSYPGSGMDVDVWFEKGVGIVREDEIHNGTIGEIHVRLVRFEPASQR